MIKATALRLLRAAGNWLPLVMTSTLLGLAGCNSSSSPTSTSPSTPPPTSPPTSPPPPPPPPSGDAITVSGLLKYELPPANSNCRGLNFSAVESRPIRRATVQLLDASGSNVLGSTVSDDNGAYSFTLEASTDYVLRVRAESVSSSWNIQVRNNVDLSANPPPLTQRPLYVMDHAFTSGTADDPSLDLTAATGWGGNGYTGNRSAAPFSILDVIYEATRFVQAADPGASFPPLDAYWSPDNTSAVSGNRNEDSGEIGTSYYVGNSLFLLGKDGDDAEEFDRHVIAHEWGHYFEDNFSRSDSVGGGHGLGDILDMRVAFGEGFATALAGMILDDPGYCDTLWFGSNLSGFRIDIEGQAPGTAGWFNEVSVMRILYDLWDTDADGADDSSIGFGPIYAVMTGQQKTTEAYTSIFSFATYLKRAGTGQNGFIDALLVEQDIDGPAVDVFGSNESNDGPGAPNDVFPLYTPLALGVTERICVDNQFDSSSDGNKLSEYRYLLLDLPQNARVTLSMETVSVNGDTNLPSPVDPAYDCSVAFDTGDPQARQYSDPDFSYALRDQYFNVAWSCEPNSETPPRTGLLPGGRYRIDLNEFRHADPESPASFDGRVCFDFRVQ